MLLRELIIDEIVDVCGLEVDKVLELLRRDKNVVFLDILLKEDEDSSLVEFILLDVDFKDVVIYEVE